MSFIAYDETSDMVSNLHKEFTDNTPIVKQHFVVEIIGPAGAGKTTLLRALSQCNKRIQSDIRLSKIIQFPFFIRNTFYLLPTYLRQYRHSRWFNRRETRSMVYLEAVQHILGKQTLNNDVVIILDHGPIYRLAFLRELGPEITTSQLYKRWWISLLNQWTATLNLIIWLDAPNVILLDRIHTRDCRHTIKMNAISEQKSNEYLNHYRTFLKQTIAEFVTDRNVTLLCFDTNQESVEQIADKVLAIINQECDKDENRN